MHRSAIRVAYQGVPRAYSEAAAVSAYPNSVLIPCDQFAVTFQAVEAWIADSAVIPVYNSVGGQIYINCDLLTSPRLKIVGEVVYRVRHCLFALPRVPRENITRVISHP
ncbi:Arogenate dehydratase 1 [Linum grandiflorum]